MSVTLPPLPYAMDALAPEISKETLEFHYGKHHKTYCDKLSGMIQGTQFEKASLEEIIQHPESKGPIFNNAAQVWNHTFYWSSLSPEKNQSPSGDLKAGLEGKFGSVDEFVKTFTQKAAGLFGSGWTWLVKDGAGNLDIVTTPNAENPMTEGKKPLFTCDVWEHAYYIDYRNARPKYLEAFWKIMNWKFAEQNYQS